MKNLVLYPYDLNSGSGKLLAETFDGKRVRPDGNYVPNQNDLILNWGMSDTPNWANNLNNATVFNHWDNIKISSNKLKTFQKLKENNVNIPIFSTNKADAETWLANKDIVVCRKILCGSQGDGIVICKTNEELNVAAPETKLFVKYFKRKHEYRVFVADGEIFDFSQKKKKENFEGEHNNYVRNLAGGYVFCRNGVVLPEVVKQQSIAAAKALNLQITAIDIGYNESLNMAVVFEANCAFAFEDGTTTFESVKKIINKWIGNINNEALNRNIPVAHVIPSALQNIDNEEKEQEIKNLKDEIHKLAGVTDIELRSVDNTLRIYGKVVGRNNHVKIMEINNPEISFYWED